jgi:hypothetical protein
MVLREADGSVRVVHDHHVDGLFPRDLWLRLLSDAEFPAPRTVPLDVPSVEAGVHEVFVGRAPEA